MFEKLWELSGEESFVSKCVAVVVTLMTISYLLSVNEFGLLDVIRVVSNVVIVYASYQINKGDMIYKK